ncbi:MAG: hypothetical protein HY515_03490 [Candidatus Aenigmarchaeota archaeon]|nr:hypothetical protein [Candidatus Aenigmarchaeota archaeon]
MDIIPRTMMQFAVGILVIVALVIAFQIGTSSSKTKLSEISEHEKEIMEKAAKFIQIQKPEIKISSAKSDEYRYTIKIIAGAKFEGTAEQTFIPVIIYKGVRARDIKSADITMKPLEARTLNMEYQISSSEPPIIVRNKERKYTGNLINNQLLVLKNFSFVAKMKQGEIPFIDIPDIIIIKEPRFGPCTAEVHVQCPYETPLPVKLSLKDEDKKCEEQIKTDTCRKSFGACGADVDLELIEFNPESFLDELKPGRPKCVNRVPKININVGEIKQDKFAWQLGEELVLSFWTKPKEEELENCWLTPSKNTKCLDLLIGGYSITIPLDSYTS